MTRRPLLSTLFPYTTLFRSSVSTQLYRSCAAATQRWRRPQQIPPQAKRRESPRSSFTTRGFTSLGLWRSEEHTSELQSRPQLVCRLLLEKKTRLGEETKFQL